MLLAGKPVLALDELVLDVDDEAEQWVNVLLETVKLPLLTVVSPVKRFIVLS